MMATRLISGDVMSGDMDLAIAEQELSDAYKEPRRNDGHRLGATGVTRSESGPTGRAHI